jgi:hypothetical protein
MSGLKMDDQGLIPGGVERFSLLNSIQIALGPIQLPVQWVPGDLPSGVKQQGHEADHSVPFSGKVKNGGTVPPFPHTSSWCFA